MLESDGSALFLDNGTGAGAGSLAAPSGVSQNTQPPELRFRALRCVRAGHGALGRAGGVPLLGALRWCDALPATEYDLVEETVFSYRDHV